MVVIGIDPHKGSHTAVAIDEEETKLAEVKVSADRRQLERLLKWAIEYPERSWAIESAGGLGVLLCEQLERSLKRRISNAVYRQLWIDAGK